MAPLRLATRGSPLALHQTDLVADALRAAHPGLVVEVQIIRTAGDDLSVPLDQIGGQGVFVTAIEAAVADGRADAAVHSAKDMPSTMAPGLVLAAVPPTGRSPRRVGGEHVGRPAARRPDRHRVGPAPGPTGLRPPRSEFHRDPGQHGPPGLPGRGRVGRRRGRRGGGHGAPGLDAPPHRHSRSARPASAGRAGRHRGAVPVRRRRRRGHCCPSIDDPASHRGRARRTLGVGRPGRQLHRPGRRRGPSSCPRRPSTDRRCACTGWWRVATGGWSSA